MSLFEFMQGSSNSAVPGNSGAGNDSGYVTVGVLRQILVDLVVSALSGFKLLFGGVTNAFPALVRSGTGLIIQLADGTAGGFLRVPQLVTTGSAGAVSGGEISIGATTAGTVGAAGGGSALPATPVAYIIINVAGTQMKIPYYNT